MYICTYLHAAEYSGRQTVVCWNHKTRWMDPNSFKISEWKKKPSWNNFNHMHIIYNFAILPNLVSGYCSIICVSSIIAIWAQLGHIRRWMFEVIACHSSSLLLLQCLPFWPLQSGKEMTMVAKVDGSAYSTSPFYFNKPHTTLMRVDDEVKNVFFISMNNSKYSTM